MCKRARARVDMHDTHNRSNVAVMNSMPEACEHDEVLVLCSGPYERPDGLGAFLNKFGLEAELVDSDPLTGEMRVRIVLGRTPVGRPAGVRHADGEELVVERA